MISEAMRSSNTRSSSGTDMNAKAGRCRIWRAKSLSVSYLFPKSAWFMRLIMACERWRKHSWWRAAGKTACTDLNDTYHWHVEYIRTIMRTVQLTFFKCFSGCLFVIRENNAWIESRLQFLQFSHTESKRTFSNILQIFMSISVWRMGLELVNQLTLQDEFFF